MQAQEPDDLPSRTKQSTRRDIDYLRSRVHYENSRNNNKIIVISKEWMMMAIIIISRQRGELSASSGIDW